ncbi:hypothetical protein [Blastococcus sp. SYSU DS0539]
MPQTESTEGHHVERHRDGSVRAGAPWSTGSPTGTGSGSALDGTRLRCGSFDRGRQTGEWTTYDRSGTPYEVTTKA